MKDFWKDYSKRDIQAIFCNDIYSNFQSNSIMVAEAGAGLGKSLAYLIAGLKYAKENNKKLIISTYTKALQEQLFYKDIPILVEYLNLNLKAGDVMFFNHIVPHSSTSNNSPFDRKAMVFLGLDRRRC